MAEKKKTAETVEIGHRVLDSSLEEILADRFGRYSKSIIQERALPDARDGLKPVQRRILWAMYEEGNTFDKPYRKSAKTVGNVIGNYHPHGDISVYDAIVRMSQDWKTRIPLIDMQGNNGSIDDDPAAAMRYTEARLSEMASALLTDIEKDTVSWTPNFSDESMEPTVLPAAYPNLLVQGVTGIAAGYATNIPPHNFSESVRAAIWRLNNPEGTLDEAMEIIPGPDFPTGGIVMGKEGIRQAFETGKGRIFIRAKTRMEETRAIKQIIIEEIPFEVVKSNLVKRMDDLRFSGKISGILDIRDESDRNGLRIVLDLKKEANEEAVLNYLYKNSDLQVSYNYNVIAIVNKAPRQLGLLDILDAFLSFREEVIIRRSRFDLAKREKRAHIVEGLIRAISILDEVIAEIRASKNKADARNRLMERWSFSEDQAEAIITLQLYRLSNTDITALEKEAAALDKEIRSLKAILSSSARRKKVMISELEAWLKHFDVPRKSLLIDEIEEVVVNARDMVVAEEVMVVVSRQGYFRRVSLRSYNSSASTLPGLREGDALLKTAQTSTLDSLVFFTDRGRMGVVDVFALDETRWKDTGPHMSSLFKTEPDEKVVSVFVNKPDSDNYCLILATRAGQIKRLHARDLPAARKGRLQAVMNVDPADALVSVAHSEHPEDNIVLVSRTGYHYTLPAMDIPSSGAKSRGVRGMKLSAGDELLACEIAGKGLVLENAQGVLRQMSASSFISAKRPARGSMLFKAKAKGEEPLLDACAVPGQELYSDQLEHLPLKSIAKKAMDNRFGTTPAFESPSMLLRPMETLKEGCWQNEGDLEQGKLFDDAAFE